MASVKQDITIKEYQGFVKEVYGLHNDRYFSNWDMISNVGRFAMRGLKGIRKEDRKKTRINLLISFSWFTSTMNQLHIDLENEVWQRFPFMCSYCASCPCVCKEEKVEERKEVVIDEEKRPRTLEDFQNMFNMIYPSEKRTLEHAGIHLAEELGEFSEVMLGYRGSHKDIDFRKIPLEAADIFSCFIGVFNSLGMSVAKELATMFFDNCHVCHKTPCQCDFSFITQFES